MYSMVPRTCNKYYLEFVLLKKKGRPSPLSEKYAWSPRGDRVGPCPTRVSSSKSDPSARTKLYEAGQVLRSSPITSSEDSLLALSTLVISNLCSNVIALGIQASGHTTNQPMQEGPSSPPPRRLQTGRNSKAWQSMDACRHPLAGCVFGGSEICQGGWREVNSWTASIWTC